MKNLSGYQLENPMHKVMQASYQMNFDNSFLMTIYTYTMKKLTNVSPFLLLLVPVFMMMAISLSLNVQTVNDNEVAMKTAPHTEVATTNTPRIR